MATKKLTGKKIPVPEIKTSTLSIDALKQGNETWAEKPSLILLAGILMLTLLVFSFGLNNELVNWDDDSYITNNALVHSLSPENIVNIFTTFYTGNYHPITLLSYAIEYNFVKEAPFLYHLNNLILHSINVILLFYFLMQFTGNRISAGITTLLFAIHPLHVESVSWAAERKDVLYTCFFFLSMIMYERYLQNRNLQHYLLLILFFILSCMSKGMAVVLPAALVALDFAKNRPLNVKTLITQKAVLWMIAIAFGIIAIWAQEKAIRDEKIYSHTDNIFIASYGYVFYLWKTIVPLQLSCFYPYPVKTGGMLPWFYYAATLAVMASAFLMWRFRDKARWAVGAWLFFIATIIMVSQILPVGAAVAADRYFYLASVGVFLLVGEGVRRWIERKPHLQNSILGVVLIISLSYAVLSWKRVQVWENSYTLFMDVIDQFPAATFAYNNIGTYFQLRKESDKALEFYLRSVQINKNYDLGYINLAIAYNDKKEFDKAIQYGERGMQLNPNAYDGWASLGFAYDNLRIYDKSVNAYQNALKLKPGNETVRLNLANALRNAGQTEAAIQIYNDMLQASPKNADVMNNLGYTYAQQQKYKEAEGMLLQARELNPELLPVYNNLGFTYAMQGQYDRAIAVMQEGLNRKPSAETYNNLGNAYGMRGQNDTAIEMFRKSIEMDSTFSDAWNNLAISYLNMKQNDMALQYYLKAARLGNPSARTFLQQQGVNW